MSCYYVSLLINNTTGQGVSDNNKPGCYPEVSDTYWVETTGYVQCCSLLLCAVTSLSPCSDTNTILEIYEMFPSEFLQPSADLNPVPLSPSPTLCVTVAHINSNKQSSPWLLTVPSFIYLGLVPLQSVTYRLFICLYWTELKNAIYWSECNPYK